MSQRVKNSEVPKGRAHFPVPIEEKIMPSKAVLENVGVQRDGYIHGLSYPEIQAMCGEAEKEGFGRGAIVILPDKNYRSASVFNWGIVTGMNHTVPRNGAGYPGPCTVTWPFRAGTTKSETQHFITELFLVYSSPTQKEIEDMTADLKAQFGEIRR